MWPLSRSEIPQPIAILRSLRYDALLAFELVLAVFLAVLDILHQTEVFLIYLCIAESPSTPVCDVVLTIFYEQLYDQ